jgi:D-sedoheptulose 7-phosphate isomerase
MGIKNYYESLLQVLLSESHLDNKIKELCEKVIRVRDKNAKVLLFGNGGSSALCSHVAVDFTKAAKIDALCLNDTSMLTCFSNDYGYENTYANLIKKFAKPNDLIILVSSSGSSLNIINAAKECINLGLEHFALTGFGYDNKLKNLVTNNIWVDSNNYNYIELSHLIILLYVSDFIKDNSNEGLLR